MLLQVVGTLHYFRTYGARVSARILSIVFICFGHVRRFWFDEIKKSAEKYGKLNNLHERCMRFLMRYYDINYFIHIEKALNIAHIARIHSIASILQWQ